MRHVVVAWMLLLVTAALASGCQLIVDFDRSRIPPPDMGTDMPADMTSG